MAMTMESKQCMVCSNFPRITASFHGYSQQLRLKEQPIKKILINIYASGAYGILQAACEVGRTCNSSDNEFSTNMCIVF
jgi:hypothetical protein